MNWLNSIDNILEHGLVRGQDDDDDDTNFSQSTATDRINDSTTWSDDEGESSHHRPSFVQNSTIDEEEENEFEEDEGGEDEVDSETNKRPSLPPQPLQRTIQQQQEKPRPGSQPVRPGNIRLRLRRNVSSSSSEEDESDSEREEDYSSENENTEANPSPKQPSPEPKEHEPESIPMSDHESLLSSLQVSKCSYSIEGTNSSGMPMSVQDSDTSSTGGSPLSQIETEAKSPAVQLQMLTEVSYVGKIKPAMSISQSPKGKQALQLQEETETPFQTPSSSPMSKATPPKDELAQVDESRQTEQSSSPVQPATSTENEKSDLIAPSQTEQSNASPKDRESDLVASTKTEQTESPAQLQFNATPEKQGKDDVVAKQLEETESLATATSLAPVRGENAKFDSLLQLPASPPSTSDTTATNSSAHAAPIAVPALQADEQEKKSEEFIQHENPLQQLTASSPTQQNSIVTNSSALFATTDDDVDNTFQQQNDKLESPPKVPISPGAAENLLPSTSSEGDGDTEAMSSKDAERMSRTPAEFSIQIEAASIQSDMQPADTDVVALEQTATHESTPARSKQSVDGSRLEAMGQIEDYMTRESTPVQEPVDATSVEATEQVEAQCSNENYTTPGSTPIKQSVSSCAEEMDEIETNDDAVSTSSSTPIKQSVNSCAEESVEEVDEIATNDDAASASSSTSIKQSVNSCTEEMVEEVDEVETNGDAASASSGWSWNESQAGNDNDDDSETGTAIDGEQESLPHEQATSSEAEEMQIRRSSDSELEEPRVVMEFVSAEGNTKESTGDHDQQEFHATLSMKNQALSSSNDVLQCENREHKGKDEFQDTVSNHVDSSDITAAAEENSKDRCPRMEDGENKQTSTSPHWIPQSERTVVAANLGSSNSSSNAGPKDAPESSLARLESEHGSNKSKDLDSEDQGEARQDPKLFDIEVEGVTGTWREDSASLPKESILNCYGSFHIRVLRAQRLPCPRGSTVQAKVSLLPWKGRARTERRTTFLLESENSSSFDHGVCAQWDDDEGESSTLSLVHAYAGEATPIPTIKTELTLRPMGMLEFSICSLTLPCDILMKRPGTWTRKWFLTEVPDAKTTKDGQFFGLNEIPMVELEAVFLPDDQSLGTSFVALDTSDVVANGDDPDIEQVLSRDTSIGKDESTLDSLTAKESESDEKGDLVPSRKPHLLRFKKFWKPATCGQCSTSLLGWKTKSYRCEACGLDCCEDCRLHLDVQIPCGSGKATETVSNAIQNKLTVSRFLHAMAPVDEDYEKKRELVNPSTDAESSLTDTRTEGGTASRSGEKGRIGVLKLNIARACVFRRPLCATSEPDEVISHDGELRPGDYYVRVCRNGSESSARTRTIPSDGKLKFEESSQMRLDVAHYGVDFFIEVVDAITDKPVGTSVLTTQGLLQQQRDVIIEEGQASILTFGSKPPTFKGKRRMTLELRAGIKSGESGDFFVPSDAKAEQGEISGFIELAVGLEEDVKRLFGPTPYECPVRPPDPLNLSTLQLHISRLSDFVEDIVNLVGTYQYVVSWRSPFLTGFVFVLFLAFTIKFNSEYVGCLPFLFSMVCMLASAFSRSNAKKRFIQEEADEWKAAEKEIDINYTLHRPIGRINICVSKGKHIRSLDTGLAGNVGCRVFLDPLRFATEKQKEKLESLDKATKTIHEISSTESKFTTNPVWENVNESEECRRLKQVLPHHGNFFETEEELANEVGCEFPVLQPFRRVDDDGDNPRHVNATLEPWKTSTAGVVFQIRFRDILNMLPGSDHIFGEVALPLATITQQSEMSGWFQVLEVGAKDFARLNEVEETPASPASGGPAELGRDIPKIFLTVRWTPSESPDTEEARETDREASIVIQEELLRWEVTNRDKDKLKQLMVKAMSGGKTVSGFAETLQNIQNFLGKVANTLEAVRNLLNFTDPYKSSLVLAVVFLLWIILSLLPTRLIIFVGGLAQFGTTAKTRLEKVLKDTGDTDNDDDSSVASDLDEDEEDENELLIWLRNAFLGLPTDEDLRKAYFWEGRRIGAHTRESYANEKRLARLKRLWRAQWHAMIKIRKIKASDNTNSTWDKIFAVVQGRRFLWWKALADFDSGRPPQGRIFLAGHAGLSGLSPLEMREIDPNDVPLVVGIFGRGLEDQQRVTLLCPNDDLKESLENAVIDASIKGD